MSIKNASNEQATEMISNYLHWHGPATFFRRPYQPDLTGTDIGLVGVPYCGGNPVERMQYLGPRAVRNRSMGYVRAHREFGVVPFDLCNIRDIGDPPMPRLLNPDFAAEDFQAWYEKVWRAGITPISVGGDHSITWPILRAAHATTFPEPIAMIHFDAHTDTLPALAGTKHTAGGFGYGAIDNIIDRNKTVQIGIRGPIGSLQQDDWAKELGFRIIGTEEVVERGAGYVVQEVRRIIGNTPTYLSFDLDALDPVYAPGVADPEVDGLTIREVRKIILGMRGANLIGADFVCYCPPLDNPNQITALTVSLLMHDVMTIMAENKHRSKIK